MQMVAMDSARKTTRAARGKVSAGDRPVAAEMRRNCCVTLVYAWPCKSLLQSSLFHLFRLAEFRRQYLIK